MELIRSYIAQEMTLSSTIVTHSTMKATERRMSKPCPRTAWMLLRRKSRFLRKRRRDSRLRWKSKPKRKLWERMQTRR
jgi:hypothetical protein